MKTILYAFCVVAMLCTGCKKEQLTVSSNKELLSFSFEHEINPELISDDITCDVTDSVISGIQGTSNGARTALVASFTTNGAIVLVNGVPQVSGETVNDFSTPVTYTVMGEDGSSHDYVVKFKSFTGIPIIYLTTEGPVTSKDVYVNGTIKVDGNMDYTEGLYDGKMQIKGRGNSTWYQDKKPYKIKLDKKSKMLGMPSDKEWALLANWFDKSLLRNKTAYELSERFNMTYTSKSRFVEVFMNGSYLGNYLLIETMKTSNDRLKIDAMDPLNPNDSTGGFFVQIDHRLDGAQYFRTDNDVPIVMETPETVPAKNLEYIKNYINRIEYKIYHYDFDPNTGYAADLDIDKMVDWYLFNEIMLSQDAAFFSSVYMHRDRGGKLSMGPVWDYDLSSGDANYEHVSPEGWGMTDAAWLFMLVRDNNFTNKMKIRWNQLRSKIFTIPAYIDQQEKYIQHSQKENFKRWDILSTFMEPNQVVTGSHAGEVAYFKDWMQKRIEWMDREINK